jgi:hypothetical protein
MIRLYGRLYYGLYGRLCYGLYGRLCYGLYLRLYGRLNLRLYKGCNGCSFLGTSLTLNALIYLSSAIYTIHIFISLRK